MIKGDNNTISKYATWPSPEAVLSGNAAICYDSSHTALSLLTLDAIL